MKFLIFAMSLFTIAAKSQQSLTDIEACASESSVKDVTKIPDNNGSFKKIDSDYECLHACLWRKQGIIKDGKFDFNTAFDHFKMGTRFPLAVFREKLNVCVEKANQETNECFVSKVYMDCMNGSQKTQKHR